MGNAWGDADLGISVITVAELTNGVERAKSPEQRQRRLAFIGDLVEAVDVHPVTLKIARRTGTLSGQEAARGVKLPFEDLLIGATALELGLTQHLVNPSCRSSSTREGAAIAQHVRQAG